MYNPIIKQEFINEVRKSSTEQYVNLLETIFNIVEPYEQEYGTE